MTHTDQGTKIKHDWMPLAMANGIEWMSQRKNFADRFDCLYRNHRSLNALLWYIGASLELAHHIDTQHAMQPNYPKGDFSHEAQ